jgi:hypothetical protein
MQSQTHHPNRRVIVFFGCILWLAAFPFPARCELWIDPEPPLSWKSMLICELVVVAKYESHEGNTLTLQVLDVLKGDLPAKQSLKVKLQHLYTIETAHVGWDRLINKDKPPDGIPKLCYKLQINNPGNLEPFPILDDAREPALFFFPTLADPALKLSNQVQPHLMQAGWRQALDGKPMDLLFRLRQHVSSDVSRAALEELGKTRDRACMKQLFQQVLSPDKQSYFDATKFLARLAEVNPEIYDDAKQLLATAAPGTNEYRFFPLAMLMTIADAPRAKTDLQELFNDATLALPVRKAALSALGRLGSRDVAELGLKQLRSLEFGEAAIGLIGGLLTSDTDTDLPKRRSFSEKKWLLSELAKFSEDKAVPSPVRAKIKEQFRHAYRVLTPLDLGAFRQRMLDPADKMYGQYLDNDTYNLHLQARELCDPRLVPILVEVLDKLPAAGGHQGASLFQGTLKFYAELCPRAMRRELEQRNLPARFSAKPSHQRGIDVRQTMQIVGLWPDSGTNPDAERCAALAQQVRQGKLDESALIEAMDQFIAKRKDSGLPYYALGSLWISGGPQARQRFLAYLDAEKKPTMNRFSQQEQLSYGFVELLSHLYPSDAELYFEHIRRLLKSQLLMERTAAVQSLTSTLNYDFDFDPESLENLRTARLAEIEPWFQLLQGKTATEARIALLRHAGVSPPGDFGDSWLKPLESAAGADSPATPQALYLIAQIVGENRCLRFSGFPSDQRQRALAAYLDDLGRTNR